MTRESLDITMTSNMQIKQPFKIQGRLASIVVSILGALITLLPSNPINMTMPSRDSGVFLYVGWRFLSGDIPYRDVWDHKPPLIYFVDAFGLALTPGSLWGLWLLQFLFIFFTLFFVYKLLDREFEIYAALAGTIILTSGLIILFENGNVTEEYALVFQAWCFWLVIDAWKKDFPIRSTFWIGVLGGLAFNFKQTTIGLWITYALLLLAIRVLQRKFPWKELLSLLGGWLIPSLVLIVYLTSQHAFTEYWEQAFLYNFAYIGKHEGISRFIPVFLKGFAYLKNGWVLYLALLGWLTGLAYVWLMRKRGLTEFHPLILIALVNLPFEIVLVTVSGRSLLHYYLTLLPVMSILAGTLVFTLPFVVDQISCMPMDSTRKWISGILLATIVLAQLGQIHFYKDYVHTLHEDREAPVVTYISENTREGDQVLVIGAESRVNFMARRAAPTRYVYQYPLGLLGKREMYEEFFNQILQNKPILIIDTRGATSLEEGLYVHIQKRSKIVRDGVKYLGEHYQQVAGFGDWSVYRLAGKYLY